MIHAWQVINLFIIFSKLLQGSKPGFESKDRVIFPFFDETSQCPVHIITADANLYFSLHILYTENWMKTITLRNLPILNETNMSLCNESIVYNSYFYEDGFGGELSLAYNILDYGTSRPIVANPAIWKQNGLDILLTIILIRNEYNKFYDEPNGRPLVHFTYFESALGLENFLYVPDLDLNCEIPNLKVVHIRPNV